ncbi:chalcone-flavanone isomerase family protein [Actinidia rufa]|uniref:Chalcone-flavonone isomerase family protein n=1 Tax=Actinidia rufa TaxID=165716 RepID=A0A7J0EDR5_9ERIC|nr:chalcone-flavanone isomerase family protein [Actinidia rufa]
MEVTRASFAATAMLAFLFAVLFAAATAHSAAPSSDREKTKSSLLPLVTPIQVESHVFPPTVKPPGMAKSFFLGGAGVKLCSSTLKVGEHYHFCDWFFQHSATHLSARPQMFTLTQWFTRWGPMLLRVRGLEIEGKFVKFTAIGVYLEEKAVPSLAIKWKGKSAEELTNSIEFFRDIVTGPFGKFTQVRMILPLTGKEYSEKVAENCVAYLKAVGTYTNAEAKAVTKFLKVFKNETFPPGASVLFTQSTHGSLTISFSKDGSIPKTRNAIIKNKQLAEAVLESIIGKDGVSPAAKQSLAARMSELLKQCDNKTPANVKTKSQTTATKETSA